MGHNPFFVMPTSPDYKRGARGYAVVTWKAELGAYQVEAFCDHAHEKTTVAKNEGGFRGRQWEVTGMSDNQYRTLREAAQAFLAQVWDRSETHRVARELRQASRA